LSIQHALEDRGHRVPSDSTIRRILHREGLITPQPAKRPRNSYIRFQADLPNERWQADITHWYLNDDTTRVDILDFIDDHSR
ncbi:IS481 family transposase, partial [Campylobacter jejuni]